MRFSVIIPAYQCADTIRRTIESILKSNFKELEIIIIDDGSTDGTQDVCKILCEKYPIIQYYRQINKGVSVARNNGLLKATGEYVMFIDADDEVLPLNIKDIEEAVNEQADIIMFGMQFCYYRNERLVYKEEKSMKEKMKLKVDDIAEQFPELFEKNYLSAIWNKIIKRTLLVDNEIFFNSELINYEDLEFSIKALKYCSIAYILPDQYYIYRNEYNVDHTINRIAKIEDIISNTDLIASIFFDLDETVYSKTQRHLKGIYQIVLQIYEEIFCFKLHSIKYREIKEYCYQFIEDKYVKLCLKHCPGLNEKEYIRHIKNKKINKIYFHHCYITVRHAVANRVKLLGYYMKRKYHEFV